MVSKMNSDVKILPSKLLSVLENITPNPSLHIKSSLAQFDFLVMGVRGDFGIGKACIFKFVSC